MKTSKQWIEEVEQSSEKLVQWLERQYVGDSESASILVELCNNSNLNQSQWNNIKKFALDKFTHSKLIAGLLISRKIALPEVVDDECSYMTMLTLGEIYELLSSVNDSRLSKLEAIIESSLDDDIKETFALILKDERYHASHMQELIQVI